ncbi:phenylacetate--CoA ligase family protein [Nocardioides halotolerans]|uniref:phenylacetate--CoA ligase family protein n=1 Tax=Nocardioides halotolerans TaxID=433660 RepID=UPI0003FBDBF4|nr:phenylacetate--CoA ligase family protein [Nocardioides halotolerans]
MTGPDVLDDVEVQPWDQVVESQFRRATGTIQDLRKRSELYADTLDQAGIGPDFEVRDWSDLTAIPLTDKNAIRASLAAHPPLGRHLAVDPSDVTQIQATSGTTGSPSYFGLTPNDVQTWARLGARGFYAAGFRPGDVVLHAWSLSKGFTGGVPVVRMLQQLGAVVVPIGAEGGMERILTVAKDQAAVGLCTAPNYALYLADMAERTVGVPATELAVRSLVVGGEPGGGIPSIRSRIEAGWNATCCEVLGNSDIATIVWAECPDRSGMHFIGQDIVLAELVDPEKGTPVEPAAGAVGELIYTALEREASPLLRFKSGDLVEVLGTECSCGRTSYKLRCFGRTDDMLLVRGINVWPTAVQEIVAGYAPRTTGAMRIVLDFEGYTTNDHLRIEVERGTEATTDDDATLARDITSAIRSKLVFQADVHVVGPGEIEPPGAGKVKLVERRLPGGGA